MKKLFIMIALMAITTTLTFAQSKTDMALNETLTAYYNLKNALATDQKELAIEKAKLLLTKVDAVPHKDFPAAQHQLWMQQSAVIKAKTNELIHSDDIKAQRKSFEGISYPMIKLLKNIKFNSSTVYIQHCPMAKASWLNEKAVIENPYYGKMMFDCGDIAETIKTK